MAAFPEEQTPRYPFHIEIDFQNQAERYTLLDPLPLRATLRATLLGIASSYTSLSLEFEGDRFYLPLSLSVSASEPEKKFRFLLQPKSKPTITDLKALLGFSCSGINSSGETEVLWKGSFKLHFPRITGALFPKPNDPKIAANIALIGSVGSGKSSFVNSCYSIFSNHVTTSVAAIGGSPVGVSTTTMIRSYRLFDLTTQSLTNIRLWDTPGKCTPSQFQALILGRFQTNSEAAVIPSPALRRIDCVIFFSDQDGSRDSIREHIVLAQKMKIPRLFVTRNHSSEILESELPTISNLYKLEAYHSSSERSFSVDRATFIILFRAAYDALRKRASYDAPQQRRR